MRNRYLFVSGLIVVMGAIAAGSLFLTQARASVSWQSKVDSRLLDLSNEQTEVEFILVMAEQADLSGAELLTEKVDKGAYVYERLTTVALKTQSPVLKALQAAEADYRRFWITNGIWAKGDATLLEELAKRSDVRQIRANPYVQLDVLGRPNIMNSTAEVKSVEWNIELVRAPEVWAAGIRGQGIVIGGQDTGYDWQHPALIDQYRGWNGTAATHDFNWHDAIHDQYSFATDVTQCGFDSPVPCDDYGHGTHTMGIMAGDDGAGNQIGMAPEARWIGCRNMLNGVGTPATYMECYEWFIAPYPTGGDPLQDGDPAKAPHVINNSWSCPISEGCIDPDILKNVVENVRAAGILTVHSAGNGGYAGCSTIDEPAAIYDDSFTVAATMVNINTGDETIAPFSSRGPVIKGDNSHAKPDISAPGVNVRSSIRNGNYGTMQGTSMAAPHVAGLAALLMSAKSELIGDVGALEEVIQESSVPFYSEEGCGGDTPSSLPNHVYGWGRIDARLALDALDGPIERKILFLPILMEQ